MTALLLLGGLVLAAVPVAALGGPATSAGPVDASKVTRVGSLTGAGYVVQSATHTFTEVNATLVVPTVKACFLGIYGPSFWVGIGGYNASAAQNRSAPTFANAAMVGIGYTSWSFFRHTYCGWGIFGLISSNPSPSLCGRFFGGGCVSSGNRLNLSVKYDAPGHRLTERIHDVSSGAGWVFVFNNSTVSTRSAEWVGFEQSFNNFSPFTAAHWTSCRATIAGVTRSIAAFAPSVVRLRLVDQLASALPDAVASALNSGGGAFTVTWKSS